MCRDGLGRTPAAQGVPLFLYSVLVFVGLFECSRAEQSARGLYCQSRGSHGAGVFPRPRV